MNSLPHLQPIFEKMRAGYHLSHEDGFLHAALMNDPEGYKQYFAAIGLNLVKHERDFFYFEAEERDETSVHLPRVAVFAYVLIDYTASQGQLTDSIMTAKFSLRGLPHFSLDSYRAHLRQVGLNEPDDLKEIVQYLARIGWAKLDGDEFHFLRPFYRMFDKCLELSKLSTERAEKVGSESGVVSHASAEE